LFFSEYNLTDYLRHVKTVMSVCFALIIVVSTLSLSIQTYYVNYLCTDTQEYLTIAGKNITVCGKSCSFEVITGYQDVHKATYSYNFNAPPVYFEQAPTVHFVTASLTDQLIDHSKNYKFLFQATLVKPPMNQPFSAA